MKKKSPFRIVMAILLVMLALISCNQDPNADAGTVDIPKDLLPEEPGSTEDETTTAVFPFSDYKSQTFFNETGGIVFNGTTMVEEFTLEAEDGNWYIATSDSKFYFKSQSDGSWLLESYTVTKNGEKMVIGEV